MSNTQPLPDVTQPTVKPATSLERLVRIETLLADVRTQLVRLSWLVVIALLLVTFVLGHVWR